MKTGSLSKTMSLISSSHLLMSGSSSQRLKVGRFKVVPLVNIAQTHLISSKMFIMVDV